MGILSIFKLKPEVYTAQEIQNAFAIKVIAYVENLKKEITEKQLPAEIEEEYSLLLRNNFVNSSNTKRIEELKKIIDDNNAQRKRNIEAVKFMDELYRAFGKNCLLINFDNFFDLLEKYNLVCGSIENYTGTVPLDKLKEIDEIKDKYSVINRLRMPSRKYSCIEDRDLDFAMYSVFGNDMDECNQPEIINPLSYPTLERHFKYISPIISAADFLDKRVLRKMARFPYFTDYTAKIYGDNYLNRASFSKDLFICAPKNEMKSEFKLIDRRTAEDPFICGYTDLGIVIFSKWGLEAEDKIFNRYEELKKVILNR